MSIAHEGDLHDRVSMCKEGPVAVSEVQAPDLDVLVSRPADKQVGVRRDVHGKRRELVAVQAQEELQAVREEDLDGAVQQGHCHELACIPTAEARSTCSGVL